MLSIVRTIWEVFLHAFQKRVTVQYPEEKVPLPPRWRGRIILSRDPDGGERCVACYLCSAVCPVDCIHGTDDSPQLYINPGECIDCGACEPECPVEAIYEESALPDEWKKYTAINADFFK